MKENTKNPYANHGYTVKAVHTPKDTPAVTKTKTEGDLRSGGKK